MPHPSDIVERFGLPRELVTCPDCGELYGRCNRKVCKTCECCSKCCKCPPGERNLVMPEEVVDENT
jgi:hypothetical protein